MDMGNVLTLHSLYHHLIFYICTLHIRVTPSTLLLTHARFVSCHHYYAPPELHAFRLLPLPSHRLFLFLSFHEDCLVGSSLVVMWRLARPQHTFLFAYSSHIQEPPDYVRSIHFRCFFPTKLHTRTFVCVLLLFYSSIANSNETIASSLRKLHINREAKRKEMSFASPKEFLQHIMMP